MSGTLLGFDTVDNRGLTPTFHRKRCCLHLEGCKDCFTNYLISVQPNEKFCDYVLKNTERTTLVRSLWTEFSPSSAHTETSARPSNATFSLRTPTHISE